jgi:hypothetical protein
MEMGTAIRSNADRMAMLGIAYGGDPDPYKWDTLDVVKCWKCPKCGHSEYLDND